MAIVYGEAAEIVAAELVVICVGLLIEMTIAGCVPPGDDAFVDVIQRKSPTRKSVWKFVPVPVTMPVFPSAEEATVTVPAPVWVESTWFGSKNSKIWNGLMWMWKGWEIWLLAAGGYVALTIFHSCTWL